MFSSKFESLRLVPQRLVRRFRRLQSESTKRGPKRDSQQTNPVSSDAAVRPCIAPVPSSADQSSELLKRFSSFFQPTRFRSDSENIRRRWVLELVLFLGIRGLSGSLPRNLPAIPPDSDLNSWSFARGRMPVTPEEKGELQEKAAKTMQTVSDWIRAKCLDSR